MHKNKVKYNILLIKNNSIIKDEILFKIIKKI